ncbi:MAG: hypothetical protein LBS32_00465, partial [Clostridiales Family XIII bacterium]|nr:hypothetical protein [Clostridiales Family XIII bacterium]
NIARLGGYFDALLRCKASPNLRVRLRFAPRKPPNYLANSTQHLVGGAILTRHAIFAHLGTYP